MYNYLGFHETVLQSLHKTNHSAHTSWQQTTIFNIAQIIQMPKYLERIILDDFSLSCHYLGLMLQITKNKWNSVNPKPYPMDWKPQTLIYDQTQTCFSAIFWSFSSCAGFYGSAFLSSSFRCLAFRISISSSTNSL